MKIGCTLNDWNLLTYSIHSCPRAMQHLILEKPKQFLNKAYQKLKVGREDMERFKGGLIRLLDKLDADKSEEHAKNDIRDFLLDIWYKDRYHVNVKERIDLAIHIGPKGDSPVGVLFETKKPGVKADFPSKGSLAAKAFYELILYYLRERIDNGNTDVRTLIVTNGFEWFLFDSQTFEPHFYQHKALREGYIAWSQGQKADHTTQFFYDHIAKPIVANGEGTLEGLYFDIRPLGPSHWTFQSIRFSCFIVPISRNNYPLMGPQIIIIEQNKEQLQRFSGKYFRLFNFMIVKSSQIWLN